MGFSHRLDLVNFSFQRREEIYGVCGGRKSGWQVTGRQLCAAVWRLCVWILTRVWILMVCWFWVSVHVSAQGGAIFDRIIVEGIETETIRSYLLVQEGETVSTEDLDLSLKNLFATGFFSDVCLERHKGGLVISVMENPIINRIAFEGNVHIRDRVLRQEVPLKPRTVYTRKRIQKAVQKLLILYHKRGRFSAIIKPKIIQREQNRVEFVF